MLVEIIQYLRPNGVKRMECAEVADSLKEAYEDMMSCGFHLAAEVLTTGHVSLTIEDDEKDVDIELVENGPNVLPKLEAMIQRQQWKSLKV